ncbi:MAG TPA: FlgD immunoglobulin-like domain containing protein [Burkholderiaceae bacterium]|nr:FlgD immunoglobulin-like domain containing protein [Burkholderiaceae bacterium]
MTISSATSSSPSSWNSILANSTVSQSTTGTIAAAATSSLGSPQDLAKTFLTLLVAQMNNQDPLNPVDNTQLTEEMAQISTVTGINNLNTTVASLMSQLQQSAMLQSAQLTGHSVMVAGSNMTLASNTSSGSTTGESAVGAYSLASAAQNVTVTISDASGQTVKTLQLGPQGAGLQDFSWDGTTDSGATAAVGNYQFTVQASSSSGAAVKATSYNLQTVVGSVPQSNGTTQLMLGNGTQVPYSAIAQII